MNGVSTAPATPAVRELAVSWWGLMPYTASWDLQKSLAADLVAGTGRDTLLLLEHPPVYTLGRNSLTEHILVSSDELARRGATVERIDRGGEVTFHGPGQLVAYPVIKLGPEERSISRLVDNLEQAIIDTLGDYGLPGERLAGQRGVWTRGRKMTSVGLSLKRWVVTHGMALNVAPDLSYFTLINPCGHPETVMTSMERELGQAPDVRDVGDHFARHFARRFNRTPIETFTTETQRHGEGF
jgi:lipoate-protein ligase B